ncbi:MAG: acetoacetate decarboxylase [Dehalococcoidia bacterium]|nr:acetoacetate decarboxylase [Dehalococcoidia bacterium]
MSLSGWTLPQTPSGKSSILPPPPWHYSGEIISADFKADPARVAELMPPGVEPKGDGSCSFVFADWCSAADLDPLIKEDPARGQYREAYLVLYGTFQGKPVGRVPFIWVDSDLSLIRGLIQGFPKKLGSIAMSRPVEVGQGGPRKEVGARFTAHVSSAGRRLCTVRVDLDEQHEKLYPPAVATPLLHTRLWPGIEGGAPTVHEFARAKIAGFELGTVFSGSASVEIGESEFDEVESLKPTAVGRGYIHSFAFSYVGGEALPIGEDES